MTPKRREQLRASGARYYARNRDAIRARARGRKVWQPSYRLKRAFLNRWKLTAGCFDCGYNANAFALDFDHVIGKKSFGLGYGPTRAWKPLLAEIAKCVVRCANCHRIKTQTPNEEYSE